MSLDQKASIETTYNVYDDSEGVYIQVATGEEGYGITIKTNESASIDWHGKCDILIPNLNQAKKLAEAILKTIESIKDNEA